MKTLKLIICIVLVCSCSIFAQTPATPATPTTKPTGEMQGMQQPNAPGQPPARLNRYMVQIPHTKEQCPIVMAQMKEKGPIGMRFDWGCASGEHIGFAMLPGASEDAVRSQLPDGVQKMAKITKVERANPAQMPQMQK